MSINRFNFPFFQGFVASTGAVGAGWKLYFWKTGTTDEAQTTYSDAALTTANTNPVVADANGRWPDIFLQDAQYSVELTDENDVRLDLADPVGTNVVTAIVGKDEEPLTATADGQTVFTLTTMSYTPGSQMIDVFYRGSRVERDVDYQETSSTSITWIGGTISNGDRLLVVKNSSVTSSAPLAANTSYTPAGAGALSTDVQSKLREFEVFVTDYTGTDKTGVSSSVTGVQAAANYASSLVSIISDTMNGAGAGTLTDHYGVSLIFPGGKYSLPEEIVVDPRVNIKALGRAQLVGDDTGKCFVFDGDVTGTVKNIVFSNFTTAVEFDTNNISAGMWYFEDVAFYNCTTGIDSKAYADSRSTILAINGLRGGGTDTFVKSYTDVLWMNRVFVWNKDDSPCFQVDSRALVQNSALIPVNAVAGARWFDFLSTTDDVRSLTFDNVRFSGENGGITAVYNYAQGINSSRNVIGISFRDCYISCSAGGPGNNGGAVVLTENTGASVTPNWLSFDNCVLNGPTSYVAVRTESGSAITNPTPVAFQIYADKQSIYRGTAGMNTTTYSFVESGLESNYSYETRRIFTDRQQTLTATGSITVDILEGRTVRFAQTGATTVTGVDNGATDDEIKFLFTGSGSNVTVQDRSVAGSLYLQGASNFSTTAQDTLVMAYDDVATNWYETSRSAN